MPEIDPLVVAAGTVAAFLESGAYYAVLANQLAAAAEPPAPWKLVLIELLRCLALVTVVAGLAGRGDIDAATGSRSCSSWA